MPRDDIPEDANFSPDTSSIESAAYENVRSTSSSEDIFLAADPYPQQIFSSQSAMRLAQMTPQRYQHEPKLDELLRQVSGSNNLVTLAAIQMRVMSTMVGLHRLNVFLPALVSLNLDGSSLNSLRDLGCGLTIKHLNVSRCGLRSFDGAAGLTAIEHLVADFNHIRDLNPLSALVELNQLSVRSNCIPNVGAVSFLSFCPRLNDLDLSDNPVCHIPDYVTRIVDVLPGLLILDGRGLSTCVTRAIARNAPTDETAPASSSEFSSSLTTSSKHDTTSDISNELLDASSTREALATVKRASSATENDPSRTAIDVNRRPSTAEPYRRENSLSSGEPIHGNIIAKVRRGKRTTAWANSRSSSVASTNVGDDTASVSASGVDDFPTVLPQQTIELELGILPPIANANEPSDTNEESIGYDSEDIKKLLVAAEKWRTRSRANRTIRCDAAVGDSE